MKKVALLVLILFNISFVNVFAEKYKNLNEAKLDDVLNLKFVHSLEYYIRNANIYSPVLWENQTIDTFWDITGKSLPTVSYNRSYDNVDQYSGQSISISFDVKKIFETIDERQEKVKKSQYTKGKLFKDIANFYAKAINLESVYKKLIDVQHAKEKILKDYEKLHKKGGIADYKLTELKLEILETVVEINNKKNELIEIILELYFVSGIKLKS